MPKKTKLKLVSQAEFGRRQGVTKQRISALVAQGMPTHNGKIDPAEGKRWWEANVGKRQTGVGMGRVNGATPGEGDSRETLTQAKTRKERALADLRSFEVLEKRAARAEKSSVTERAELIVARKAFWLCRAIPWIVVEKLLPHEGINLDDQAGRRLAGLIDNAIRAVLAETHLKWDDPTKTPTPLEDEPAAHAARYWTEETRREIEAAAREHGSEKAQ
jgi:hypothetical protein